ncbi:MAG: hypothetical protein ACI8XO_005049 [Verrucomicrobiales bacterium]|jgi:hypothetical protein
MRLNTRRVEIAGVTESPDGDWVRQVARNLTACGGFLDGASHLLVDRAFSLKGTVPLNFL